MKKLIVYLDQSFVSTMAKQAAGTVRAGNEEAGRAMGSLYEVVSRLVDQEKIICPSSTVHYQESNLDSRIADDALDVVTELAGGVAFQVYTEVGYQQTVRALRRYLGMVSEPEGMWEHAFYSNPHRPLTRPRVTVRLPSPAEFTEDDRNRKARMLAFNQQQKAMREGAGRIEFAEARRGQMEGVVRHVYTQAVRQELERWLEVLQGATRIRAPHTMRELIEYINLTEPTHGLRLLHEYLGLTGDSTVGADDRYWRFFASPEFDAVPFYDVFCCMQAGFIVYLPTRAPKGSDPYDFAAVALTLPYVDIVTTDQAMKDMVVRLGLDKRYGVDIYSSSHSDVRALTERLEGLT